MASKRVKVGSREFEYAVLAAGRAAFAQDSADARARRKAAGEHDLLQFGQTYLPHYFEDPPAPIHQQMAEDAMAPEDAVTAAPRGSAKSTLYALLLPLHGICYQTERLIVIAGDTQPMAETNVDALRQEIEENQKLRQDFGDLVGGRKWSQAEFLTTTGIRVVAKGVGTSLRGLKNRAARPTLFVVDDAENDESVESESERARRWRWLTKAVRPALDPKRGRLKIIGTLLHHACLTARCLASESFLIRRFFQAIEAEWTPEERSYWPARESIERLRRLRTLDPVAFSTEYQNRPINPEEQEFRDFTYYEVDDLPRELERYGALDPSLGKTEKADFQGKVTVDVDAKGILYVRDAWQKRYARDRLVDVVIADLRDGNYRAFGIEEVGFQEYLKQDIDAKQREARIYVQIEGLPAKGNKIARIAGIAHLVNHGTIRFRSGEGQAWLVEQLRNFPKVDHDDGADALEMVVRLIKTGGGRMAFQTSRHLRRPLGVLERFVGEERRDRERLRRIA